MSIDHEKVILAGIVPSRRDLLLYALQHLTQEHFRQEPVRNIFVLLGRYYDLTGDILPAHVLSDQLSRSGADAGKQILYEEILNEAEKGSCPEPEFRYSVDALKDIRSHQKTGEAITMAFEVLERGATVEGVDLHGHTEAREYLYSELAAIDRMNSTESSPEGDMRNEGKEILTDYADRKSGKRGAGVLSGIRQLDLTTSGFQNGELILLCAYTAQGKTHLSTQTAWHASVMQGKNVFFATSETTRVQVRRRLLARHTRLPQFGQPQGINSKKIKDGALTVGEEAVMQAAIDDLTHNSAYGTLYVAQVPRGATLGFVEARLARQAANFQIDLVVIDYLALIKPDRKRQSAREEYNDVLKDAKVMATSFDQGRGVPVISPWAMSQSAWKEAIRTGDYSLANLAETSEAEKSSDVIVSLLRQQDAKEVRLQFLKNRDGETPPGFNVDIDFRNSYFGERETDSDDAFGDFEL